MTTVTANGNTYSADGSTAKDMNEGGFRDHLLPMLGDVMVEADIALVGSAAAAAAAASSAASALSAPGTSSTSTTSLTVGYGAKTLTTQAGKLFKPGMALQVASAAAPTAVYMHCIVGAYDPVTGVLDVVVDALNGLASVAADWIVSVSAPGGAGLGFNQYTGAQFFNAGIFEGMVNLGAGNDVNLAAGTLFKKAPTANWALTVSGIPAGASACFIIELTNAGFYSFTPPAGTTYPGNIVPSFSTVGTDAVAFYKYSGGNWRMLILAKAIP